MEEVEGPLVHGEFNYSKLRGETGPLVYPGGFVWVFAVLRWAAGGDGSDIRMAQWIFLGCYIATHACVLATYGLSRPHYMPPAACLLLILSKRLHSIYLLRLFNDCWSLLFLHAAVLLFAYAANRSCNASGAKKRWTTKGGTIKTKEASIAMGSVTRLVWMVGCLLYSYAVSIKMNIFTFAPALLLLMLLAGGTRFALAVSPCRLVCMVLALLNCSASFHTHLYLAEYCILRFCSGDCRIALFNSLPPGVYPWCVWRLRRPQAQVDGQLEVSSRSSLPLVALVFSRPLVCNCGLACQLFSFALEFTCRAHCNHTLASVGVVLRE